MPLVALIIIFDSGRDFFAAFFRAGERMEWDAATFLIENAGIATFGFILLRLMPTAGFFTLAYVFGTAIGAAAAFFLVRPYLRGVLRHASFRRAIDILRSSWPFAVTGALGILLTSSDILIISWMKTASDVGIYSAAIRIVQALYLIASVVQVSTLPLFARLAQRDHKRFQTVLERTLKFIFSISIPLSFGGAILGTAIMGFVFGPAYAVGGAAFSILMLGLSFDYASGIVSSGIFSYDHQKNLILFSAIGGVANVVFDVLLIPRWGIAGSSVATLLAQILSNTYLWYAMKKLNHFQILSHLPKILGGRGHGARFHRVRRAPRTGPREYCRLGLHLSSAPLFVPRVAYARDQGHYP